MGSQFYFLAGHEGPEIVQRQMLRDHLNIVSLYVSIF